jgi:hypothetical protein
MQTYIRASSSPFPKGKDPLPRPQNYDEGEQYETRMKRKLILTC